MNHSLSKLGNVGPDDEIRIFEEIWLENSRIENMRSAYGMVIIGFPVKQVEWYPLGTHRFFYKN